MVSEPQSQSVPGRGLRSRSGSVLPGQRRGPGGVGQGPARLTRLVLPKPATVGNLASAAWQESAL